MTENSTAKPTRRTFLAMTIGGAVVAGGAAGLTWWIKDRGELDEIEPPEPMSETGEVLAGLLRERLDMLELPDATISKWVNRYEKHRKPWTRDKVSRKDLQNFLLSTDFFPAADESKPLRFVAYYDPYISVCYNPLRYA
ncbi:hypothetical protein ENSA5_05940 [Enhygromyxa salina]|uniref:Uncharacterized protein n=1 Tax=Enhygromyxa salina TaxID=215803 RepID=A0A2S9YHX5_9BACT|nr:hypothetical protein [Enhygromyxa salina]PRQ04680.1 hypothetical protein ENSA5_05940 [Enhygromyxa salina]